MGGLVNAWSTRERSYAYIGNLLSAPKPVHSR